MNNLQQKNKYLTPIIFIVAVIFFAYVIFLPVTQNFIEKISSKISQFATILSSSLVLETNDFRLTNNENNLVESPLLMTAAQMKADDMARKGYFSHIDPQGEQPWFWFNYVGYKYSYAGENLAIDFNESPNVILGWINSAKHKANLLNKNFTEIGVGVANGVYEGHETTFIVQFFGKPYNNEVVKVATSSVNLLRTINNINPTTAVATGLDILDGKVLGMDVNNTNQINNDLIKIIVFGISFIILIFFLSKIVVMRKTNKNIY